MIEGAAPTPQDVSRLAALHAGCLPGSVLSLLGEGILQRYYRMVIASPTEEVFLARIGDTIAAAAVLSFEPSTVLRRFLSKNAVAFAIAGLQAFCSRDIFRRQVTRYGVERLRGRHVDFDMPEITQIFTDPKFRQQGLGKQLLRQVEELFFSRTHHREYFIRTLAQNNEPTIGFYRGQGFQPFDHTMFCGDDYVCMRRRLAAIEARTQGI